MGIEKTKVLYGLGKGVDIWVCIKLTTRVFDWNKEYKYFLTESTKVITMQ